LINVGFKVPLHYGLAPQSDGASEHSNQTIEIALRYYLATLDDTRKWPELLSYLPSALNNATSRGTGLTPTTILYGFKVRDPIAIASQQLVELGEPSRPESAISTQLPTYIIESSHSSAYRPAHVEANDAIMLAAMWMKRYYDRSHKPMFFKPGDFVSLRLHRGYNVPGLKDRNVKIEQQFAGPFKVLERVGRLAYRIQLPSP
jgi:hypothetical protein